MEAPKKLSGNETVKRESDYLRGQVKAELTDRSNNEVSDASYELLKFHGSYFGYDRDSATARKQQGLGKEYEFMLRLKMPAGRLTADQYLGLDVMADKYSNGTMRITTRETIQFHCITKQNFTPLVQDINRHLMSTMSGCGDVTRNIITCPAPIKDKVRDILVRDSYTLARYLAPKSTAYYEIFLDGKMVDAYPFNPTPNDSGVAEPLYGDTYMPRKFKFAIADAMDNCMDALTNDVAFFLVMEDGELKGYNLYLGGGLGMNHNTPKTYPRLASPIAFIKPEDFIRAAESTVKLQRDHGDRSDRKHARLKYVVEEKGIAWTQETLAGYFGAPMEAAKPITKFAVEDHTGWHPQGDGKWFVGVPVSSGRITDRGEERIRTGLREVIAEYKMNLTLTADQNIILCDIEEGEKGIISEKLRKHGIKLAEDITPVYKHFIACVALPTCGKALAEAERVKLPMVADLEQVMDKHGLLKDKIAIRLAGCPNGCPRPYVGDIGIVGRTPEHYSIYIGGDFEGTRLNSKVFDKVPYASLPALFDPMFALYKEQRSSSGEGFGDFCHRYGIEAVKAAAVAVLAPTHAWAK